MVFEYPWTLLTHQGCTLANQIEPARTQLMQSWEYEKLCAYMKNTHTHILTACKPRWPSKIKIKIAWMCFSWKVAPSAAHQGTFTWPSFQGLNVWTLFWAKADFVQNCHHAFSANIVMWIHNIIIITPHLIQHSIHLRRSNFHVRMLPSTCNLHVSSSLI